MIEKQTVLDQIEITRSGTIQLRFGLLLVEDGVEIDCKWHRTVVNPGDDIDAQITAVNDHLLQMGKNPVPAEVNTAVKAHAAIVWTPTVIATYAQSIKQ